MIPDRILQHVPALALALGGIAIILAARSYSTGTLTSMGPGFMPILAAGALLVLVLAQVATTWRTAAPRRATPALRPLLACAGSILAWALLAEPAGFLPACAAQLLLAYAAVPQRSWRLVLMSSAVISLLVYILFAVFLGVPLQAIG